MCGLKSIPYAGQAFEVIDAVQSRHALLAQGERLEEIERQMSRMDRRLRDLVVVEEIRVTLQRLGEPALDGPTLAAMFRAQARAVEVLEKDPTPFVHYFVAETGGLIDATDLQVWRLLHAPPQPYTRERFEDEYNWTVKWNMTVPGATYDNTVDNRAWE